MMLLLIMLRVLRNHINHSKSNDIVSSLSGVKGREEHVNTFDTINTKHTPPLFSELTISFFEMDNSIMSLFFSDLQYFQDNNILPTKHTPPLLHHVSHSGVPN